MESLGQIVIVPEGDVLPDQKDCVDLFALSMRLVLTLKDGFLV